MLYLNVNDLNRSADLYQEDFLKLFSGRDIILFVDTHLSIGSKAPNVDGFKAVH